MTLANYQPSLNFEQILALVKQLPYPEKLQLCQELEKEVLNSKLTVILESFKTDELSLETIAQEVESIRSEIHAKRTNH